MEKIRINNDVEFYYNVYRNGVPESFIGASNISVKLVNEAYTEEIPITYSIDGNVLTCKALAENLTKCGVCRMFLSYTKADTFTTDAVPFQLVGLREDTTVEVGEPIIVSGDIGVNKDGSSAYEVWEAYPGNEGKTIEEYFLWLRENPTKIDLDGLNSNIDKLHFKADTLVQLTNIGDVRYSQESRTLEVKVSETVSIQLGQEMQIRVKNDEAIQINNGQMVYINSAVGANPLAKIASTSNADIAQRTFGMATENIASNGFGAITTEGLVRDINTSAFSEGAMLWLGTNGNVTNIEPTAPTSKISVGMVLRSNANNGVVYVKIRAIARNQKLSDVYAPTLTGGDVLRWNSTTLRFETFNITSALSNKVDTSRTITAGNGLTGGGSLTEDRTINVATADDSLVVAADSVKVNTNNTLTSTSTTQPLSANQGRVLNEKVVQVETDLNVVRANTLLYKNGYIDPSGKYVQYDSAISIILRVVPGKKYMLNVRDGVVSTSKFYAFTQDLNGQIPVGVRSAYIIGDNIVTAPDNCNYLFVCAAFGGTGNIENYEVYEYISQMQSTSIRLSNLEDSVIDISENSVNALDSANTVSEKFNSITKIKNIYDYENIGVVAGIILTGGVLHTSGYSTGLIPVKANHYYYLSNRKLNAIRSIRCIDKDTVTKSRVRVASTGEEPSIALKYYLPNFDGSDSASNGQFKTSPSAAFIQISLTTLSATELGDNYKIMIEDVGDNYYDDFIPSPYEDHKINVMDTSLEYPVLPIIERLNILEGKSEKLRVLLIGSSHGMNTIGQFPILAHNSGVDIICANAYQGSLSIQQVAEYCTNGATFNGWYKKYYDGVWHDLGRKTILQMLKDEDWDYISIQRAASEDMTWTDQQKADFETVLDYITSSCNYTPTIVFNSGFADSWSVGQRYLQQADSDLIWSTAQNVKNDYGIEIIPMAPALQLVRNNDTLAGLGSYVDKMLSCDSQHLDQGIGMYVSGCTCFNFFLKNLGRSVLSCNYLPSIADITPFWYDVEKYTPIDEMNAKQIRKIINSYFANNLNVQL